MSLSGSPIVNHGPVSSDAEVLIPLGNGQVKCIDHHLYRFLHGLKNSLYLELLYRSLSPKPNQSEILLYS